MVYQTTKKWMFLKLFIIFGTIVRIASQDSNYFADDINKLKAKINKNSGEIKGIQDDVNHLEKRLTRTNNNIWAKLETLEKKLTKVEKSKDVHETIAFTAHLTGGLHRTGNGGARNTMPTVPFDKTVLNIGGHYNTETYSFTCPYHGLYLFSYSLYSDGLLDSRYREVSSAVLIHKSLNKDSIISGVYSRNTSPKHTIHVQGSSSAILECKTNDTVRVGTYRLRGNQMWGDSDVPYSIFTGVLMNKLN